MASNETQAEEPRGLTFMLRALRYRNYRLFFGGQTISLIGTWMQQIAMSWLVFQLTHSAFYLGLVTFAAQIPAFVVTPFAGLVVDRFSRHRILVATQTLAMLQAFALAWLTYTGRVQTWQIIVLGVYLGLVNALDMPTRQAFLVEMVERKEDLGNAIALNSSMFNGARLVGPSIAGVLIPVLHESGLFLLNGISYIAVIIALLAMRVQARPAALPAGSVLEGMREGFAYVYRFQPMRSVILLLGLVSLVGAPYTVLMPVVASSVLHGGAATLGFLMGAAGVGALGGAVYLASRRTVLGFGRLIILSSALFGIGLALLAYSTVLWLALLFMVVTGAAAMLQMAASNTIIQTLVEDRMRGRVMSIYTMAFIGTGPIGSLAAGGLANRIGVGNTFLLGGGLCILGALYFGSKLPALREMVRPIYVQIGVLPEEALGVRSATPFPVE